MVHEAIGSALPSPRKKPARPRWMPKAAVEVIDRTLEAETTKSSFDGSLRRLLAFEEA
jgi:hypothetical protein